MNQRRTFAIIAFALFGPAVCGALPEAPRKGRFDDNPLRDDRAAKQAEYDRQQQFYEQYHLPPMLRGAISPGINADGSLKPLAVTVLTADQYKETSEEVLKKQITVVPDGWSDFLVSFGLGAENFRNLGNDIDDAPRSLESYEASRLESLARGAKYGVGDAELLTVVDQLVFSTYLTLTPIGRATYRTLAYDAARAVLTIVPPATGEQIKLGSPGTVITNAIAREYMRKSQTVVLLGDPLPPPLPNDAKQLGISLVRHARRSANVDPEAIGRAARKGVEQFTNGSYIVLNALPNTDGIGLPFMLSKMNLSLLDTLAWRGIVQGVRKEANRFSSNAVKVANRANVLNELEAGASNVLLLVAHNQDKRIYLPDGTSIGFGEIEAIKRQVAPDRTIVLVTCEAGGVGGIDPSLAELLLQNRLATSVFASQKSVNASDVPKILAELSKGPMRASLLPFELLQIVSSGASGEGLLGLALLADKFDVKKLREQIDG